ncbi:uncharacterized protein B0I36DRAFT_366589 [Microdochium trichocladiopsis]|uniref:HAD-like domain-containing protein n=1 Tax=Microdochium trichocladiopsis TaxID=1682393 RepID=A0A9P8XYZ7_9PEZI|nr:uncharacterized protein B0I36DRAFT_366589 [Microdochium trichocladiopsis]KAH7024660.1 hypothetical protein B0I36DRAFT_366589 [Microdochium trichocladiopsis]
MVLVIAGGIAARGVVIIKSAVCTERARKVTDIVFDKTGTITEAELDVSFEQYFRVPKEKAISIPKELAAGYKHPVSIAELVWKQPLMAPELSPQENSILVIIDISFSG